MKNQKLFIISLLLIFSLKNSVAIGQQEQKDELSVRGMAIAAPKVNEVDRFVNFIHQELEEISALN